MSMLQLSLKTLIQFMGGKVRKDTSLEVTHLVAKVCKGEKYSYAMLFGVPVVSETWIHDAWQNRDKIDFKATDDDFVSYPINFRLYYVCHLVFHLHFPMSGIRSENTEIGNKFCRMKIF